ncbi:MAG: serpin family protein, partial [Verrucomicrobiota bacterium]
MKRLLLLALLLALRSAPLTAASPMEDAASSVNRLGFQLLPRLGPARENVVLSPYSIQAAFALAYAGADGATREELRQVLGYPESDADLALGLPALQRALEGLVTNSVDRAAAQRKYGVAMEPLTLTIAHRLFGQAGYPFRPAFLSLTRDVFGAPFETVDFHRFPDRARRHINDWVADRTRQRIRDLIPADGVDRETRLVLVNALHFKSGWREPFSAGETQPRPFHLRGGEPAAVATLHRRGSYRFIQQAGQAAVFLPFATPELECVIVRPDAQDGLAPVEAGLSAATWKELEAAAA